MRKSGHNLAPWFLLASLISSLLSNSTAGPAPDIPRIEFGVTTLRTALFELGPSYSIYLEGQDGEGVNAQLNDPIILQYEDKCQQIFDRPCSLFVAFDGVTPTAESWSVAFDPHSGPSAVVLARELTLSDLQKVRVDFVEDVEGLEPPRVSRRLQLLRRSGVAPCVLFRG